MYNETRAYVCRLYRFSIKKKTTLRSQLRFKSDLHNVYTEEENKIAISSNNDKRLQTCNRTTTYPYRTNGYKVCESEMMELKKKMYMLIT